MKPIFSVLSPNVEEDDIRLARHLISHRFDYQQSNDAQKLAEVIGHYVSVDYAIPFQNGRSALWAIIQSYQWPAGSQIIVPGFTCAAAVNPIIWSNLKPVFIDIDQNLNLDLKQAESKISNRTKAILIQHTFGLPVNMTKVRELADRHNLVVIEDCAHSLGAFFDNQAVGSMGEAAFFSFGRDKILSAVFGGIAVTNNQDLALKIKHQEKAGFQPRWRWVKQQLRHPLLVSRWVQPGYVRVEIGRWILLFFQKTKILSKAMTRSEKKGQPITKGPGRMPNELAVLALNQFLKLERYNHHRQKIADLYRQGLMGLNLKMTDDQPGRIYLKFPIILNNKKAADDLLKYLRTQKIYLYDGWKDSPVVPADVELNALGYLKGSCPRAEELSERIVNLPTHINVSEKDAQRIIRQVRKFLDSL
jgi:dTDP-4-amino-4,6-dideoxygalactose transaminase